MPPCRIVRGNQWGSLSILAYFSCAVLNHYNYFRCSQDKWRGKDLSVSQNSDHRAKHQLLVEKQLSVLPFLLLPPSAPHEYLSKDLVNISLKKILHWLEKSCNILMGHNAQDFSEVFMHSEGNYFRLILHDNLKCLFNAATISQLQTFFNNVQLEML